MVYKSLDEASNIQHTFPVVYYISNNGITRIKLSAFIRNEEENETFSKISSKSRNLTLLGYDGKFIIFRNCRTISDRNINLKLAEVNFECFEIYRGVRIIDIDPKKPEIKDSDIVFNEVQVSFSGFREWFSNWFLPQWKKMSKSKKYSVEEIKLTEYDNKEIGISVNPYYNASFTNTEQGYKPWIYIRSKSGSLQFSEFRKTISGIRRFLTLLTGSPAHIESINAFPENYKEAGFTEIRYAEGGYYGNTKVFSRGVSYKDIEQDIGNMLYRWLDLFISKDFINQFQTLLFIILYFDLQINLIVPQKTFITLVEALEIYSKGKIEDRFYINKKLFEKEVVGPCNSYLENINLLKKNKILLERTKNILKNADEKKTSEIIFEVLSNISSSYGIREDETLDINLITRITKLRNDIIHSPHHLDNEDFKHASGLIWGISYLLRALIFHEIGMREDKIKLEFEGAFITIKNI